MQSASLISSLSTAVGTAALMGVKPASTGHLESLLFVLYINLPYFIEESGRADLKVPSKPCMF